MNGIDFIKALDEGKRLVSGNVIAEKVDGIYRIYTDDFTLWASGYKLKYFEESKTVYLYDSIIPNSELYNCLSIIPSHFEVRK